MKKNDSFKKGELLANIFVQPCSLCVLRSKKSELIKFIANCLSPISLTICSMVCSKNACCFSEREGSCKNLFESICKFLIAEGEKVLLKPNSFITVSIIILL
jgi:hypothetical protein